MAIVTNSPNRDGGKSNTNHTSTHHVAILQFTEAKICVGVVVSQLVHTFLGGSRRLGSHPASRFLFLFNLCLSLGLRNTESERYLLLLDSCPSGAWQSFSSVTHSFDEKANIFHLFSGGQLQEPDSNILVKKKNFVIIEKKTIKVAVWSQEEGHSGGVNVLSNSHFWTTLSEDKILCDLTFIKFLK